MSNENKIYEDKINTIESEQTSNEKGESLINIRNNSLGETKTFCILNYDSKILFIDDYTIYSSLILEYPELDFNCRNINNGILNNRLELTENGNLFQYVNYGRPFNEEEAKFIFYKILMCVKELHENNFCHMDLELGNIFLDANYNPVIVNLGTSLKAKENLKDFNGIINEYIAPELETKNYDYNGYKVDIYNLGKILNKLVTGKISSETPIYNNIEFSKEFKILLDGMLLRNPSDRYSLNNIFESSWLKKMGEIFKNKTEEFENLERDINDRFERKKQEIINNSRIVIIENMTISNIENLYKNNPKISEIEESEIYNYNIIMIPEKLDPILLINHLLNRIKEDKDHYNNPKTGNNYIISVEIKNEFDDANNNKKRTKIEIELYKIKNRNEYFFIINNIGDNVSNCDCFYSAINKIKHELDSIIDEETQKSLEIK